MIENIVGQSVTFLGMNLVILLLIVGATELFKDFVTFENKNLYIPVSFGFSVLFTLLSTTEFQVFSFAFNSIAYFLVAKIFYDAILQFIQKKKDELSSKS